jgi:hypothetical protein
VRELDGAAWWLGEDVYPQVLARYHALIRSALAAHDGNKVDTQRMRSSR